MLKRSIIYTERGVNMRDIEQIIREVNGTMAIEGMPLTDDDKNRIRDILHGHVSIEEVVSQLTEKYKKDSVGSVHEQA